MEKNFILGVGCQKGGTTWLHSQLRKSRNVDLGFIKEYHVFDALYVPECRRFIDQKLRQLQNTPLEISGLSMQSHLYKHLSFYIDTQNYYDYFDYLWYKGGEDVTTVGDITPSYSALPIVALKEIKSGLEAKGFNVKVIFFMRDPIERCWSSVRMNRRNMLRKNPAAILPDERTQLENAFSSRPFEIRTRYELTVRNLELVFDQGNIFYAYYENLFKDITINKLKSFININDFMPDTNYKINVSSKNNSLLELDEGLASRIVDHYRSTYEFCENRFGIRELWPSYRYL